MIETKVDRKIEHFGDAIVGLAARLLAEQHVSDKLPVSVYFTLSANLATNSNLRSAGFGSGFEAELHIGNVFKAQGTQAALDEAMAVLRRSKVYLALPK